MKGFVSAAVVVAIVIASSLIVVSTIKPMIDEGKLYQNFNKAKQFMSELDSIMNELLYEASGAKRSVNMMVDSGSFIVSGKEDEIKFRTLLKLLEPGTVKKEGNLLITAGPFISAYEDDVDNDGDLDLVLENDAVRFAMQKIGSQSNWSFVNTTDMMVLIENKLANVTITPKSRITIDEKEESSYGYGYSELTQTGHYLVSAGIRLFMNTSYVRYEALFTLGAGQDFVELEIKHIY